MRPNFFVLMGYLYALSVLSSCVVPRNPNLEVFTAEQRAGLGNIELFPTRFSAEAWQGINATDTHVADRIYTDAMVFSAGDNVVGAIGSNISRGIARGQQRDFDERNADHLGTLRAALTGDQLRQELDKTVRAALAQTPLGAKLSPPYQSKMFVNIEKCGYQRVGLNAQDEVLLTPYVMVNILWMDVNPPKVHLNSRIERWAAAPHQHTAADLANRPALREAAFKANIDAIGREVARVVKAKFAE